MKNIRVLFLAVALASPAFAITWNVGGIYGGSYLQFLNSSGETYTSPGMSLTAGGFNPALHSLTSATASFWFADDDDNDNYGYTETVDIFVNGVLVANNLEVDGDHPESSFEKHTFAINDAGTLATLAAGGSITVAVKQQTGDTYLKIVGLTGTGSARVTAPDGGSSVAMLGLGLLALVGAGRFLKR